MNLPKVKFGDIPLSTETDWIYGFLFKNKWDWDKYIIKRHPGASRVFTLKNERERVKFLGKYIIQFKKDNEKTIEGNKNWYKKGWHKIEKDFFEVLSEIIGTDWPKNRKTIKAMISINPICPRFLNSWSFSIFYNYEKIGDAMEVIMHECCHFLYFEKWKKIYPKMNHKKFESPYIEWHLSEIIAPIILNDKRIQKLLNQGVVFYPEHQRLKINGTAIPKYFRRLYNENLKKNNKFEQFLNKAYTTIKENNKLFKF